MTTPVTTYDKEGNPRPPTKRVTNNAYRGQHADARGRKIVVAFLPGDVLMLRPSKTKRVEYVTISSVYDMALTARVRSERMQKLNFKKRKRAA